MPILVIFLGKHFGTIIALISRWEMCFAMRMKARGIWKFFCTVLTFEGSVICVFVYVIGDLLFGTATMSTNITFKLFVFLTGWCCALFICSIGLFFITGIGTFFIWWRRAWKTLRWRSVTVDRSARITWFSSNVYCFQLFPAQLRA